MTDRSIAGRITNGALGTLKLVAVGGVIGTCAYFAGDHAYKVLSAPDCGVDLKRDFDNALNGSKPDHALVTLANGAYCKITFSPS